MDILNKITKNVKNIFSTETLQSLAKETKFIQRKRLITAKDFLLHHLELSLGKSCSLTDLVEAFESQNISLSKQAINRKYTQETCDFLKKVLEKLLDSTIEAHVDLKSLPFIKNIKTIDSSYLKLNNCLSMHHPGLRHQGAGVKLQAIMNIASNQIHSLDIRKACENDQSYQKYTEYLEKNELSINDLGYFCVNSFKKIKDKGAFFLSRYLKITNIYHMENGQQIDFEETLSKTNKKIVISNILLGEIKLSCRIVAMRLPPKAYEQRLKNLKEKNRKNGHKNKSKSSIFDQWTIFVTNLPDTVDSDTLLNLYSLRWQIELFFKTLKTFFNLRTIKDSNPHKALCSIYVSLIATTLLTQYAMTIAKKEISLYKAARIFVKNIKKFIATLLSDGCFWWLIKKIKDYAFKEKTPKRPTTRKSLGAYYA